MDESTGFEPDKMLPIVADSWEQLRACDVFRLLETCPTEHVPKMAARIQEMRADLADVVDESLEELE